MKLKIDGFVLSIILVVILAFILSGLGSKLFIIPFDLIGSIGISLIFFFYGLKLSPEKIKTGLKNWKLHMLVQLSTFLLFPIIILLFFSLTQTENSRTIWLSFLFLAALPSTVSSSVVMVSLAKGNIPGAIFNASISGLIGIVVTPLWVGFFLKHNEGDFSLAKVYIKLITEIIVPVTLGLLLQKRWGHFALKHSKQLSTFDKSIILLIIFKSFSKSFIDKVFTSVNITDLLLILGATVLLFFLVFYITGSISNYLRFSTEDKITAQFCGTKKSLVHGSVFSVILFPPSFPIGIILLPLMIFHAFQIFIVSIFATKLAKRDG